jgi:hypothetical protein
LPFGTKHFPIASSVFFKKIPATPIEHPFVEIARFERRIPGAEFSERDDQALENFAKPFAERFLVSPIAMRIRLEKLGLLHRVVPGQRLLEKLNQLADGTFK